MWLMVPWFAWRRQPAEAVYATAANLLFTLAIPLTVMSFALDAVRSLFAHRMGDSPPTAIVGQDRVMPIFDLLRVHRPRLTEFSRRLIARLFRCRRKAVEACGA